MRLILSLRLDSQIKNSHTLNTTNFNCYQPKEKQANICREYPRYGTRILAQSTRDPLTCVSSTPDVTPATLAEAATSAVKQRKQRQEEPGSRAVHVKLKP